MDVDGITGIMRCRRVVDSIRNARRGYCKCDWRAFTCNFLMLDETSESTDSIKIAAAQFSLAC